MLATTTYFYNNDWTKNVYRFGFISIENGMESYSNSSITVAIEVAKHRSIRHCEPLCSQSLCWSYAHEIIRENLSKPYVPLIPPFSPKDAETI